MNYYWFNSQEICKKQKEIILKKKLLSIINQTKKLYKKRQDSNIRTCHKSKKIKLKTIKKKKKKKKNQEMVQYKKEALKNKQVFVFSLILKKLIKKH